MTTVAPPPTATPRRRHPRLATAVAIALLIAGLTIGLLLALSPGGTAPPSIQPAPTGPGLDAGSSQPVDPCLVNPRGPC
jgi:hypothetical protein